MDENKRFTTDNGSNEDVCLVDNLTGKEYESNFDDIVDLLNTLHKEKESAVLLANHRGEMIEFANSLIQDVCSETEREMWETFKEERYQKWKKKEGVK